MGNINASQNPPSKDRQTDGSNLQLSFIVAAKQLGHEVLQSLENPLHAPRRTMVQNNQEFGCYYWATRLAVFSYAHITHYFAGSALRASLARSAMLIVIHLLAHSLTPEFLRK